MNPVGIFAKTFPSRTAAEALQAARAAGFDCVQFSLACCGLPAMPDTLDDATAAGVARAASESDVAVAALSGIYNMIHPDAAVRRRGLTRLARLLAQAQAIGTRLVTLCAGSCDPHDPWHHHPGNEGPEAWSLLLAEMDQAAALADQFDVDLGIEPDLGTVVSSALHASHLLEDIRSEHLRIVLDPAGIVPSAQAEQDRVFAEAFDLLGDRIALLHARDRDTAGATVAPGQGMIDFPLFLQHLRDAALRAPIIAQGLAPHEAPGVAAFLRAQLGARPGKA